MTALSAHHRAAEPEGRGARLPNRPLPAPKAPVPRPCGGAAVLDLALCLILSFAVMGLLLLAL